MAAVMLSAVLHAVWNWLLRRAGGDATVAALGIVFEGILLVPVAAIAWYASGGVDLVRFLPAVLFAALLALANYEALMAAYRRADMSLVYPVARGGVFLFLPAAGALVFGERLNGRGWLSLGLIMGGIALLPLPRLDWPSFRALGRHLRDGATVFALLAAAATAGYTIWDKYAIQRFDTTLYFAGYSILLAVWFAGALARTPRSEVRRQASAHRTAILLIGACLAVSYLLVLFALRDGISTQVLAVRQLSIPIGVVLGWRLLREPLTVPRALGAVAITAGCLLAAAM
jgi:drug/metabolite transporter (DMT)-like permease